MMFQLLALKSGERTDHTCIGQYQCLPVQPKMDGGVLKSLLVQEQPNQ